MKILKIKISIYGYGKSGRSSYKFLKEKNKVFIYDDNKKLNNLFISFKEIKFKV